MKTLRIYRYIVIPLASFMVVGGAILAIIICGTEIPITSPLPFIRNESLNRQLLGILAAITVAIGMGLLVRRRIAWYALLVCFGIGAAIPVVAMFDEELLASMGYVPLVIASFINAGWGIGLYIRLRSIFENTRDN